jgi:ABC-type uncharacterized transport system involved in gliding motility auxiliary subunit
MKHASWIQSLSGLAGLLVLAAILVLLNGLAGALRWRADLTGEKLFTLSDGTRAMLKDLNTPVTLKLYFSRTTAGSFIPLKQYADRVLDLLREYERAGRGRIILEVYDPQPDSDEEEWAQRYGVTAQPLGMAGGPSLYFGLVGVSGTREAALPFIAPRLESQLEYLVTRIVHEVTHDQKPTIAVMSALPVMGAPRQPFTPTPLATRPWLFVSELQRQYRVIALPPETTAIPDDVQTVIVIHPKEWSAATLYALDQFVLRGGRLLAFVDPLCLAEQETMPELQGGRFGTASDLNRLTAAWGAHLVPMEVVADPSAASQVSYAQGGSELNPAWLSLGPAHLDRQEIATASLESVMLPFAGAFDAAPTGGVVRADLARTSDRAGFLKVFELMAPPGTPRTPRQPGVKDLMVRLTGRFVSAFPGGPPSTDGGEHPAPADHLAESVQEGAVVLVADVDLLYDRFCVRELNFFGQILHEPRNDNLNLALNLVEQLSGSEALIGLRGRGTFQRPFTRVQELEQIARQRWEQEEIKLQQKLRDTQTRINELQAAKDQDQKFILSPDQRREIENFRQQRFETQQQLKQVRKSLRRDIERLGLQVKVLNLAGAPAGVALFALFHWWRRRRRAAN